MSTRLEGWSWRAPFWRRAGLVAAMAATFGALVLFASMIPSLAQPAARVASAGVTLAKTCPAGVRLGAPAPYHVQFANSGPGDVLVDLEDSQTGILTSSVPVSAAASLDITYAYTPTTGTVAITNVVSATVADLVDGVPLTDTQVVTASCSSAVADPVDLALTKGDAPDPATAGGVLVYTLTASNLSANPAYEVIVSDTLPAGLAPITQTWTAPVTGCATAAGTIQCRIGVLPPASGTVLTFTVDISPTLSGLITNTAAITAANLDVDDSNNTATQTTLVEPAAPSPTPTATETPTPTDTTTPTPTDTETPTPTSTAAPTDTETPTPTPTVTETPTPTPTVAPTDTETPTLTPTVTETPTPTATAAPTDTETPTLTPTTTETPTPTPTAAPTDTETPTLTPTTTETPTPTPTAAPTDTETPTPTATAKPSATPTPTTTATSAPATGTRLRGYVYVRMFGQNQALPGVTVQLWRSSSPDVLGQFVDDRVSDLGGFYNFFVPTTPPPYYHLVLVTPPGKAPLQATSGEGIVVSPDHIRFDAPTFQVYQDNDFVLIPVTPTPTATLSPAPTATSTPQPATPTHTPGPTSTATPTSTVTPPPTLTPTPTATPLQGSIRALVWNDLNRNGVREGDEPPLAGVEVMVEKVGAARSNERVITGSDGVAQFAARTAPAIYKVTEIDPPYALSTTPNQAYVAVSPGVQTDVAFGDRVLPKHVFLPAVQR